MGVTGPRSSVFMPFFLVKHPSSPVSQRALTTSRSLQLGGATDPMTVITSNAAGACPITSTRAVAPDKGPRPRRLPKLNGHGQISPHLSTARTGQDMERQRAARSDVRALPTVGA